MALPLPSYSVSFLNPQGTIQSMDLPSGVDLSAYFSGGANFGQALPLSALGQQAGSFFGTPAGQTFWGSPTGQGFRQQLTSLGGSVGGQQFTIPDPLSQVASQTPNLLTGAAAASGLPQFIQGLGNLSSNFAAGGFPAIFNGLPVGALGVGGATGIGGQVVSSSAPEILRDVLPSITGSEPASAATSGLLGAGGELGNLLPGIGAAASIGTGIADLVQGNIAGGAGSLGGAGIGALAGSVIPGVGTLLGAAIGGGAGGLLGGLFGGGHTKGSHIDLPGVAPGGFDTRTAGGTNTVFKSYGEGLGALSPFEQAVQAAKTPEALVAAFNQQYSPFPGQFRIESHGPTDSFVPQQGTITGPGAWNMMNLGGSPFAPNWSPWTAAALQDPHVITNLDIQAGMLGAPAEQPQVAQQLRSYLTALLGTPFWTGAGPGVPSSPGPVAIPPTPAPQPVPAGPTPWDPWAQAMARGGA